VCFSLLSFVPDKNKRLNGFGFVLDSLFHLCCTGNPVFSAKRRFDSVALYVRMVALEGGNI